LSSKAFSEQSIFTSEVCVRFEQENSLTSEFVTVFETHFPLLDQTKFLQRS